MEMQEIVYSEIGNREEVLPPPVDLDTVVVDNGNPIPPRDEFVPNQNNDEVLYASADDPAQPPYTPDLAEPFELDDIEPYQLDQVEPYQLEQFQMSMDQPAVVDPNATYACVDKKPTVKKKNNTTKKEEDVVVVVQKEEVKKEQKEKKKEKGGGRCCSCGRMCCSLGILLLMGLQAAMIYYIVELKLDVMKLQK